VCARARRRRGGGSAFTRLLREGIDQPLRMATGRCAGRRERASPVEPADQIAARDVTACFAAPSAYRAMATAGNGALLRARGGRGAAGEYLPAPTWQARVRPR